MQKSLGLLVYLVLIVSIILKVVPVYLQFIKLMKGKMYKCQCLIECNKYFKKPNDNLEELAKMLREQKEQKDRKTKILQTYYSVLI